jgi:hypothetical protein
MRSTSTILPAISALLLCLAAAPANAQFVNENLLVTFPKNFRVGFAQKTDKGQITEYVPQAETVDNWTEMVTVQIFHRAPQLMPDFFEKTITERWKNACPGARSAHLKDGAENGYAFSLFLLSCDNNPKTRKPEITWLKAIRGTDSFYVVQKAFKSVPTKEQVAETSRYLASVRVCDARGHEHPCPVVRNAPAPATPAPALRKPAPTTEGI